MCATKHEQFLSATGLRVREVCISLFCGLCRFGGVRAAWRAGSEYRGSAGGHVGADAVVLLSSLLRSDRVLATAYCNRADYRRGEPSAVQAQTARDFSGASVPTPRASYFSSEFMATRMIARPACCAVGSSVCPGVRDGGRLLL